LVVIDTFVQLSRFGASVFMHSAHMIGSGTPATFVASAHLQESRYKSIPNTFVQLFSSSASVLMADVTRFNRDARREEYRRTI
jgi:hypothetical protein